MSSTKGSPWSSSTLAPLGETLPFFNSIVMVRTDGVGATLGVLSELGVLLPVAAGVAGCDVVALAAGLGEAWPEHPVISRAAARSGSNLRTARFWHASRMLRPRSHVGWTGESQQTWRRA